MGKPDEYTENKLQHQGLIPQTAATRGKNAKTVKKTRPQAVQDTKLRTNRMQNVISVAQVLRGL